MIDFTPAEAISRTILYEGSLLYPYRHSALKNRERYRFGCLFPPGYCERMQDGERCWTRTECLVSGSVETVLEAKVRFLTVGAESVSDGSSPPSLTLSAPTDVEHAITIPATRLAQMSHAFHVSPGITGEVLLAAQQLSPTLFHLTIRLANTSPGEAREQAMLSCQLLLGVEGGRFLSPRCEECHSRCHHEGTWPVLVGDRQRCNLLLSAATILDDFPAIAPESPGDLCDATEIDELLTLRVLTLTEEEQRAMAAIPFARMMLERARSLGPAEMQNLHGAIRSSPTVGDRVRLVPRRGADILDLALANRIGVVTALDEDDSGQVHLSVAIEDDPGMDLGIAGRPGHRFFFRPDEVELVDVSRNVNILIAGIGNIFLGDDAFGVEVVERLAKLPLPPGTEVRDFGIRGMDLVYALEREWDAVILVDAVQRGEPPGTIHVIEPIVQPGQETATMEPHHLDPASVLRMVRFREGARPTLRLVSCEAASLEPGDEEQNGLSAPVAGVVEKAVAVVLDLVKQLQGMAREHPS